MIRVLIADDHLVVREGVRAILDIEPDLILVGEAADGLEAVQLAQELAPDVVLMDLRMPGLDGIEAIEQIKAHDAEIEVVILTTYDDDEYIIRGLRAGARGYLLKDTDRRALFETVRAAARGESLLPPTVLEKVVSHLAERHPPDSITLSQREQQVLELMVQLDALVPIGQQARHLDRFVRIAVHEPAIVLPNVRGLRRMPDRIGVRIWRRRLPL